MSKIFYDHLIILTEVEAEIKNIAETSEEREELWQIVDETIHNRVLELLFDKLPGEHHDEFLEKFHEAPHDEGLIRYLDGRISGNVEAIIKQELGNLAYELLQYIRGE